MFFDLLLQLSQVGLTEKVKGDKRKFELWSRGREEVYIIQAPSLQDKDTWVKEIKRVLMNQFDQIKSECVKMKKQVDFFLERERESVCVCVCVVCASVCVFNYLDFLFSSSSFHWTF